MYISISITRPEIYHKQNIFLSQGDSGGGVVYGDKIYGVISFLGDPDNVCRKAAAFMDLCNPQYADWINKTIAWQKSLQYGVVEIEK